MCPVCPCRGDGDLGCFQDRSDLCSHTCLMENLTDGTVPLWHGLNKPYILIYSLYGGLIIPVCPAVQWIIAQSAAFFFVITGNLVIHQTCVWTVNDLLSVFYALFSGHISVVSDVGVRSTVSYSISFSTFLFADPSLPPSLSWIFSAADWLVHGSSFLFFRERNVRKHSRPGTVPVVSEKEKHVVTVVK